MAWYGAMKPSTDELRQRIVACRREGQSAEQIARWFGVSKRSVERYWKLEQSQGHVKPKKIGGYRRSRLEGHERCLQDWIAAENDLTLAELQERCREQLGVKIGINALWHRLEGLDLNFKKNRGRRRARPRGRGAGTPGMAKRSGRMGS